jgi:hypothetical protein
MPAPQMSPLDSEHLQCCNHVINDTPPALELAQACIDCNMPAHDIKQQLQQQLEQAQKIKARFFPNNP